jgi:hypothetical protein
MKNFQHFSLLLFLSGAVTLELIKVLFDSNGYFSNNSNSGIINCRQLCKKSYLSTEI